MRMRYQLLCTCPHNCLVHVRPIALRMPHLHEPSPCARHCFAHAQAIALHMRKPLLCTCAPHCFAHARPIIPRTSTIRKHAPPHPFLYDTPLRHIDTRPVFHHEPYEQWDWLCELARNTFLSELWEVRPKYWKVSIWKQYVLHRQGIEKCRNFFNIPTANKEMWRTRIILSFGTSPQKILGGIE